MESKQREPKCDFNIVLFRDNLLIEFRPKKTKSGIILTGGQKREEATIDNTDIIIRGYGSQTDERINVGTKVIIRPGQLGSPTNIKDDKHKTSNFFIVDSFAILAIDNRAEINPNLN